MEAKLIYRGSTKDIYQTGENYLFEFSDRYSVFDWGEMPDHIKGKGVALANITHKIYRYLESHGIKTHLVGETTNRRSLLVRPYQVIKEAHLLQRGRERVFIPLEVIFRFGVAKGSSLLTRFKKENDWIEAGFSHSYQELEMFEDVMVEFSTKLERLDRPLTRDEAFRISGLSHEEWQDMIVMTKKIAHLLKEVFLGCEIEIWDGKIEFAAGERVDGKRKIILVDSIGPDELRLSKDGVLLSKEVIRQKYKKTLWYEEMSKAKKQYGENFKTYISHPDKLDSNLLKDVETLYKLIATTILNQDEKSKRQLNDLVQKLRRENL